MLLIEKWALSQADHVLPLVAKTPLFLRNTIFAQGLNHLFAQALQEGQFAVLQGKHICIDIEDIGLRSNITLNNNKLNLSNYIDADVTIRGNWRDFLLLASRQEDPDTLFFRRRLIIEGNTELGLEIKNLLDSLDPDNLPPWLWNRIEKAGIWVQENML